MSRFGYQTLGFGAGASGVTYTVAKGVGGNTETDGTADGDYKYHVFNSSGTFTITTLGTDAVVEYLVIAGGGGGGGTDYDYQPASGGGGAGGYRRCSSSPDQATAGIFSREAQAFHPAQHATPGS